MRSLWERFDEARSEALIAAHPNSSFGLAALSWFDDRLVQDDAVEALREVLPHADDEQLAAVIGAVCRVVRQP